jgi:hypothetical protein
MKAVIISALLALAAPGAALAQNTSDLWTPSSVNDQFIRGVNMNTVRKVGTTRTFWAISVYRQRHDFAGNQIDYLLMRFEIDCAADTVKTLSLRGYLQNGISVFTTELDDEAQPIAPESMSEGEQITVCDQPASGVYHGSIGSFFRWGRSTGIANWDG